METITKTNLRPTFGASLSHGWDTMMKNFLILLLTIIVVGIVSGPMSFGNIIPDGGDFHWNHDFSDWINPGLAVVGVMAVILGMLAVAYSLLVVPVFRYGGNLMFVHAVRGQRPEFDTLIKGFKENYLHIVLANLLATALIIMGFIFFIIPGIIVACRLAFVSYLVMDKKMDPIVAIEESWRLTKGKGWTIFGLAILSFFLFIAGLVMLFFGVFPAIIWVKSTFASLYEAVQLEKSVDLDKE